MTDMDLASLTTRCFLFNGLTASERQIVVENGRIIHVPSDSFFFLQGEEAFNLYLLASGRIKLTQITAEGEQILVNYFGAGDGFGMIVALNNMTYPLSVQAVTDCTAVAWPRNIMRDLMLQHPKIALNALDMLGNRFMRLQERFQDLSTQRVEQRIARTLIRLVRQFGKRVENGVLVDMPISRQDLAEMTGTNLYNVSRIMSKWEQAGFISSSRKQIVLNKAHELVAIAEDLPHSTHPKPDTNS